MKPIVIWGLVAIIAAILPNTAHSGSVESLLTDLPGTGTQSCTFEAINGLAT